MEPSAETNKAAGVNKILIGVVVIALLAVAAMAAMMMKPKEETPAGTIGYATDASVMLDQDALQAAMDAAQANAENGNIALRFVNDAYSTDGTNFECYIVNAEQNKHDMYIAIFSDPQLTDQLYLSGLVPPGSGFEKLALEHPLEKGDHQVFVVLTQVETSESGAQKLLGEFTHTMDFHVIDE